MDIFCSSPSSTAICSSLDHKSMVCRGSRPIDRWIKSSSCSSSSRRKSYSEYYKKQSEESRRKSSADAHDTKLQVRGIPYIDWIDESSALIIDSKPIKHPPLRYSSVRDSISKTSISKHNSPALKPSSSARPRDQVVVLWVSIHCKGCEGKVRKHISKMEGVRSYSIDLATKKVTVAGNVTPLAVLASLSKVKNAQLWPHQP